MTIGFISLAIVAMIYLKMNRHEVVITEEKINASLGQRFPVTKKYLGFFNVTYSNPKVILLENEERVQVGFDVTICIRADGKPKHLYGTALITSGIRYASETQEFFLENAEFSKLEITGVPDGLLTHVANFASKTAKEYIETHPVYRLQANDAKTAAAKMLLKGFKIRDKAIYVSLGI